MGFFDGRELTQDLAAARPVPMTAVEAWMGKPYEEVTLGGVEDGRFTPGEAGLEHYPIRVPRDPEYRLKCRTEDGETVEFPYPWLMLQGGGGPPVILLYVGGRAGEVQALEPEPGFVAKTEGGNTFTWKGK